MNRLLIILPVLRVHAMMTLATSVATGTIAARVGGPVHSPVVAISGTILFYTVGAAAYYRQKLCGSLVPGAVQSACIQGQGS